jgi:hypothetical protein
MKDNGLKMIDDLILNGIDFVGRDSVFYLEILSQFVKPSSDTLLRYFDMFHLEPSPSSLQFTSWNIFKMKSKKRTSNWFLKTGIFWTQFIRF